MLPHKLEAQFQRCWKEFSQKKADIIQNRTLSKNPLPERPQQDILEEILALTRKISLNNDFSFPIYIDTDSYTGSHQDWRFIAMGTESTISEFLNTIYFSIYLICNIKSYTYGDVWVLKNLRTGITYDDIGILYSATQGAQRDDRPVTLLDIRPKDVLQIIKAPAHCRELYEKIRSRLPRHVRQ